MKLLFAVRIPLRLAALFSVLALSTVLAASAASAESAPIALDAESAPGAPPRTNIISTVPNWTYESNIVGRAVGTTCAAAGDVNRDGYGDLVATGSNGQFYLVLGDANVGALAAGYPFSISNAAVASGAGDLNGDGYDDVVISGGPPNFIRVYNGTAGGLDLTLPTNVFPSSLISASVGPAGDVNGDGYDDLITANQFAAGNGCTGGGTVYVYYGSATGISATNFWFLDGCRWVGGGGLLGAAAATAGDVNGDGYDDIVVGAPGNKLNGSSTASGSAYVVYGDALGLPRIPGFAKEGTLSSATRVDSPTLLASFGSAAITAGDANGDGYADVVVGAPNDNTYVTGGGIIRVYPGGPGGLSTTAFWSDYSFTANDQFGSAIVPAGDMNGDRLPDLMVRQKSQVYVYRCYNGGFLIERSLAMPGPGSGWFSTIGDYNGDGLSDLMVTDPGYSAPEASEGRISAYYGRGDMPSLSANWTVTQTAQTNPNLGWSVASAGDVNGDGYDDVLIGAPTLDGPAPTDTDAGYIALFLGGPSGLPPTPAFQAFGAAPGDQLGACVAHVGDVNGDGYCDIVAGAHQPGTGNGKVMVWYGAASPPSGGAPNVVLSGISGNSLFGAAVSGGDVNGDGYADIVVGAPNEEAHFRFLTLTDAGRVSLFLGSASGLGTTVAWFGQGQTSNEHSGSSLTVEGDVTGDGLSDLIVGAPDSDISDFGGPVDAGVIYEYDGSFDPALPLPFRQVISRGIAGERFGASVAHAGDVDGDGFGDVIIGAPTAVNTLAGEGGAFVYRGDPAGVVSSAYWAWPGGEAFANFGSSVAGAGDVNGDGYSDVLVGAVFKEGVGGQQDAGSASIFLGPLGGAAEWVRYGPGVRANLGHCVANAGDVNGDGWSDMLFGEPGYQPGSPQRQGLVQLYKSSWGYSLSARTQVLRATGPVASFGLTDVASCTFQQDARSAAGRTSLKLQWRLRPPPAYGPALSGIDGAYTSTGAPGSAGSIVTLTSSATGLTRGTPYAWQVGSRSRSLYFPRTPWVSYTRNGALEWDLRTPGTSLLDAPIAREVLPELMLSAPSPNPSRTGSVVRFALPRAAQVRIAVYDAQGRRVRQIVDALLAQGTHDARWDGAREDGTQAETGVYFYRFEADGARNSRRVVLIH